MRTLHLVLIVIAVVLVGILLLARPFDDPAAEAPPADDAALGTAVPPPLAPIPAVRAGEESGREPAEDDLSSPPSERALHGTVSLAGEDSRELEGAIAFRIDGDGGNTRRYEAMIEAGEFGLVLEEDDRRLVIEWVSLGEDRVELLGPHEIPIPETLRIDLTVRRPRMPMLRVLSAVTGRDLAEITVVTLESWREGWNEPELPQPGPEGSHIVLLENAVSPLPLPNVGERDSFDSEAV